MQSTVVDSRRVAWLAASLIVACLLLPVGLWWFLFARALLASPRQAREDPHGVLVDVRTPEEYGMRHADGAVNWPYAELSVPGARLPEELTGKRLYLICNTGVQSGRAARALIARSAAPAVFSVRGGMEAWDTPPLRESPWMEQWVAVVIGFVIKPFYMVLSLVLIIWLGRRRSRDLAALRWSMIFFLAGEIFCAVDYLFFQGASAVSEYLHSYGMTVAFAFAAFALMEGADARLVRFSADGLRCSFLELCGPCAKHVAAAPCGIRRVLLWTIPFTAVLALLPVLAAVRTVSYDTMIFGTRYNYSHAVLYQLFEIRYCPVLAALSGLAAWIAFWRRSIEVSKVLYAACLGAFGFGLFRLLLVQAFQDHQVWFTMWEELMELEFVVGTAWASWVFRARLLLKPAPDARP